MQQNTREMSSERKQKVVRAKDFDLKKFVLNTVIDDAVDPKKKIACNQFTLFPRYNYGGKSNSGEDNTKVTSSGDTPAIYTSVIAFDKKGGIPKLGGEYTKTKKDCTFFWLPLDGEYGGEGSVELENVLKQIDDHYGEAIKTNPDKFVTFKSGKSTKNLVDKLAYGELVKECDPPKTDIPDWRAWNKCKVRIPFKGDDENDPQINVTLSVPNEKTGKPETMEVTSLDELMKHFTYGCKAEFVIKVQTFWVLKTADKTSKLRKCGFKLSCDMIRIVERGKSSAGVGKPSWDDLLGGDENGDEEEAPPKKEAAKSSSKKATKNESEDDTASNEDEDEDEPKPAPKSSKKAEAKPAAKNSKSSKKEESEEDVAEDEEEEVKPVKNAKKQKKEESEEEEPKPVPKGKASKKVESEEEDEDEEPVKKPAAKGGKDKKK